METPSLDFNSPMELFEDSSSNFPSPTPEDGLIDHRQVSMESKTRERSETLSSSSTLCSKSSSQPSAVKLIGRRIQDRWRRFTAILVSTWAWELCEICLSIDCMVVLIATLPNFNGHPLADWKFILSPNTMVSIFITISKTSMLLVVAEGISQLKWSYFLTGAHPITELQHFDSASRGPWGSLAFLFCAKKRAIVASLGALITIAALAMDPFGQQVVSFETRYVARGDSRVTIPVAHDYLFDTNNPLYSNWDMTGAVLHGVFESGYSVQAICPSERCKWPPFSTLGVCSEYENVTHSTSLSSCKMEFARYNGSMTALSFPETYDQSERPCAIDMTQEGASISNCTRWPSYTYHENFTVLATHYYNTPYNESFNSSVEYIIHPRGDSPSDTKMEILMTSWEGAVVHTSDHLAGRTNVPMKGLWVFSNISNLVFTTAKLDPDPQDDLKIGTCPLQLTEVLKCQVRWCLKVFEGIEMVNGTMMPYKVREVTAWFDGNDARVKEQYPIISLYPINDSSNPLPPGPTVLRVNEVLLDWIHPLITGLFPTNSDAGSYHGLRIDITNSLLNKQNVAEIMERITDGITSRIRTGPNTTNVYGIAYFVEVYLVIRWSWLLLPGILVLLSAMFLLFTVRMSRKDRGLPLWKSRVLPFLFHGLDGWEEIELRVSDEAGMEQAGKRMKAKLLMNEEGDRKFVRV